jgi:hypothetical protein
MRRRTGMPTSVRLDDRLKVELQREAERQHRAGGVSELIHVILYEWFGKRKAKIARRPRSKSQPEVSQ